MNNAVLYLFATATEDYSGCVIDNKWLSHYNYVIYHIEINAI